MRFLRKVVLGTVVGKIGGKIGGKDVVLTVEGKNKHWEVENPSAGIFIMRMSKIPSAFPYDYQAEGESSEGISSCIRRWSHAGNTMVATCPQP